MAEYKNKDTARAWSDADAAIKTGRMDAGPKRRQSELDAKFNAVIKKADDDYAKKQSQPPKKVVEPEEPIPADIKDRLQTMKNQKAAENYEATKEYKKGGKVSSASSRADGCAQRGKTRGKMV